MTGFLSKTLTVAMGLAVATSVAVAGVPDPSQSSAEAVIVGNASGNPLGKAGGFGTAAIGDGYVVNVRDINGAAVSGATVTLNFTGAGSANPYTAQVAPATVNCGTKTISKTTDGSGNVTFRPRMGGFSNAQVVEVRANGILLRTARSRSTDIDGNGSTALNDLNLFRVNFFTNPAAIETDFDVSAPTTPTGLNDLNIFRVEFFSGGSGTPC